MNMSGGRMVGCFGLLGASDEKRIAGEQLFEAHPAIHLAHLHRRGLISGDHVELPPPEDEHGGHRPGPAGPGRNGQLVRLFWRDAPPRVSFRCPTCERGCYVLSWRNEMWQCRLCSGLIYTSKSRHKTIARGGYATAVALRRRLHISPVLFSEVGPRPLRASEWWRLLLELRRVEAALITHLHGISDVLERRYVHDGKVARRYDRRRRRRSDHP
jgi:hypothetical protein